MGKQLAVRDLLRGLLVFVDIFIPAQRAPGNNRPGSFGSDMFSGISSTLAPTLPGILRSLFIGRTILGATFAWSDSPYYSLGSGIGFWLRQLRNLNKGD